MTSTEQLFNKLKFIKSFLGVFPKDCLPKPNTYPVSLIMNTDPQSKPGEHWVAIYFDSEKHALYFDSYGFPPLNIEFKNYLNENSIQWTYNRQMIQGYNTYTCGEFCVLFVLLKTLGFEIDVIIHLFS